MKMKQLSIPATVRISVPDTTPESVINRLVSVVASEGIATIEDITKQLTTHINKVTIDDSVRDIVISDCDLWVMGDSYTVEYKNE